MHNDKSKGSYESMHEKLNAQQNTPENMDNQTEATTNPETQKTEDSSQIQNQQITSQTNNPNASTTTGSSFNPNSNLDPLTLEKHKTLTMWEAVDEAKRLVTQSRTLHKETTTLNKETATLLEESRDIRDEHKEDRQAMAELLKQQKAMIQGLKAVQETFVLISERENRASQVQENSQSDLLFKLSQFEKRITTTEERINRRYDWRLVDYGVAAILGISAYVLLFNLVGPRIVAWVGQLIGS